MDNFALLDFDKIDIKHVCIFCNFVTNSLKKKEKSKNYIQVFMIHTYFDLSVV